jgi:hypothetical protein
MGYITDKYDQIWMDQWRPKAYSYGGIREWLDTFYNIL